MQIGRFQHAVPRLVKCVILWIEAALPISFEKPEKESKSDMIYTVESTLIHVQYISNISYV